MIDIQKNSSAAVIVLHEIYDINKHIQDVCQSLSAAGFAVVCPNLLHREEPFDYSDEKAAYHHFIEKVGFIDASHKIKTLAMNLKDQYQKVIIAGFSVGATIAWLCSEDDHVDGIVGYYGSRIRDYLETSPACPVMLFFAEEERSFHINELISALNRKNIKADKLPGAHGFNDPYSAAYNSRSSRIAFEKMMGFLKRL
ncbi:dienelactone hydrolase family protein [Bacillus sonorensis]|uniref:dienelactone hydrolase family protein n=1 Tax=Bacillus sonorensis TaxID=119858 RepID=UPI001F34D533|nr:dienelactone hydrolase family protein [Bacillus sonorensis]MCF7616735.1 dienelactone hydrolase family protein [Bacillus sonorensis]